MGSALRERYDRLDELVMRKMPRSHGRSILSTVYNFPELDSWREDMEDIHDQSMQAEQKNTVGEEVHLRPKGLRRNTF
ncbi:uncharacterized protein B0H18DRAFT_1040845 [Fomitopsis serialis]|uniref:uncharacterized protein n=1 Tax=Fomitopsis serialis TaxID=139415 RepID=UPI0020071F54|nr:uncharacterized protein B0H18DRAFT_1040845 [Neoantrodia serialis]KAH9915644.1 hypothetical protein B0H18DRAFT_1040845 [Neoantrodia serialis]